MKKRFIVIVLDSFGVGAMDDVTQVRPQDQGANTCGHLLEVNRNIHWETLEKLGLINALGYELPNHKMSDCAIFGRSKLAHYGCDTYFGHQELMGTKPKQPKTVTFQQVLEPIEKDLVKHGYEVKRMCKNGVTILSVMDMLFVGDNMETDPGQALNVTGSLDLCDFDEIVKIGHIVRTHVQVGRVIAFGGSGVSYQNLVDNIFEKDGYIGIDAPASGVYNNNYHVAHIGYGVDEKQQLPHLLFTKQIPTFLYGKVADIVANPHGKSFPGVDSEYVFKELLQDLDEQNLGFFCLNIQETDLAGHRMDCDRYIDRLNVANEYISQILEKLLANDILVIMADHGNDPTSGSSKHTREDVPILIYKINAIPNNIGKRETLGDVGASAAEYFGCDLAFGTSFLSFINNK